MLPHATKEGKVYSVKPEDRSGDFTFTRSSAATRVNADGNIEKETQNLLLQSNGFDTWNSTNLSITSGQSGYDGSSDAWLLTKSGGGGRIENSISKSGVHTFSVYAKAGDSNYVRLLVLGGGNRARYYDLENGTIAGSEYSDEIDAEIEDVGNGWYRCSITTNVSMTQVRIYPAEENSTSGTSGSVYIQDAQLEQGLVARDVITTTTTAVEGGITDNVPRLDYTDSSCPALLLEPQRSNAMPYSEGLEIGLGINYKSSGVTLTANDAESPEGYDNATKFDGGLNDIADTYTGYTASTTNTFSAFLKAGTCDIAKMRHTATGSTAEITINLTSGTITNTTGAQYLDSSIVDYGNGWYRASITFTSGTTAYITRVQLGEAGYIHMYGWQIERGASYATSYIPTYGSSVTRVPDASSVTGVSDLIGQTEGTILFDWNYLSNDGIFDFRFNLSDGADITEWLFVGMTNADARAYVTSGGSVQFDSEDEYAITIGNRYKMALAYANNDFAFYINGTQVATSSSGSVPTGMDYIVMSNRPDSSGSVVKESVNQALLFKSRLTNEELAALTTI